VSFSFTFIFNTVTGGVNVHYNCLSICPLCHRGVRCITVHSLGCFPLSFCIYSRSLLNVLLCLSAMSVCVICRWCWISAVFFMWVLFRGVLQCGLLRTVFICWDFVLSAGMACVGMEGQ